MTTRRAFLRGSLGLVPALASLRIPGAPRRAAPLSILFLSGDDAHSGHARGARLAAEEARRAAELLGSTFDFNVAVASSVTDAEAALHRALGEGADSIVSAAHGAARDVILDAAGDRSIPFVDVAAGPIPDRAICPTHAFFTGVPIAEAVRTIATAAAERGATDSWSLLVRDDAALERWAPVVESYLTPAGITLDRSMTMPESPAHDIVATLRAADATRVLLIDERADAPAHEILAWHDGAPPVALVAIDDAASAPRVLAYAAGWHSTLFRFGATQLNDRYRQNTGQGMGSAAWAAWIAVKLLADTALRLRDGDALRDALAAPRVRFDGHKGTPLSFRPADHWLRQPLYAVWSTEGGEDVEEVDYGEDPRPDRDPCPLEEPR